MKGKVKLVCGDQSESFPFVVAQSLMQIQKEMNRTSLKKREGWKLPDDSPYEFKDNGFIKRTDTKESKKQAKPERDTAGNKSSE